MLAAAGAAAEGAPAQSTYPARPAVAGPARATTSAGAGAASLVASNSSLLGFERGRFLIAEGVVERRGFAAFGAGAWRGRAGDGW